MKRRNLAAALAICAAFSLLGSVPALAGAQEIFGEQYIEQAIYPQTGTRFCMTNMTQGADTVYCCMKDGSLYRWRYGEPEAERFSALPRWSDVILDFAIAFDDMNAAQQAVVEEAVFELVADGETLYALNPYVGGVGTIDEEGVHWRQARFDPTLTLDASGWRRVILYGLARDETIYLLANYYDETPSRLYSYDVIAIDALTGEGRRFGVEGVMGMCLYEEGALLLARDGGANRYVLSRLDPETGALADLPLEMPSVDTPLGGLAWDAAADAIYYADQDGIWRSTEGKAFERILPHGQKYMTEYAQGWVLSGGQYALQINGVSVYETDAESLDPKNTLCLRMNNQDSGLDAAFTQEHPDVTLDARYGVLNAGEIAQRIQSGDADTDVFQVSVDSAFHELVGKGYAASLAPSEEIARDLDALWPTIQAAITNDSGEPVAYPQSLRVNLWTVNRPLWAAYFGDEPVPATWEALFDAMLRFEEGAGPEDGVFFVEEWDYPRMVQRVVRAYIEQRDTSDEALRFQDPALRRALEALARVNEAMLARGISYAAEWDAYPDEETLNHSIFYTFGGGGALCPLGEDSEALLPFVFEKTDTPVIRGYMSVLIVNPLSARQDLALAYVASATRQETDADRYYKLHPGATQPLEKPAYEQKMREREAQRAALEEQLAALAPDDIQAESLQAEIERLKWYQENPDFLRWKVSPRGIEEWQRLAPHIRFFERSLYVSLEDGAVQSQIDALCAPYAGGQMDVQTFLQRLEASMELVWAELR